MRNLRAVHRIITVVVVVFTLYLGASGSLIQLIDLRTLFTHAPATDLNLQSIREGISGAGDFRVISVADYTAAPLSASANPAAMLATVLKAARAHIGSAPLRFIELRMEDGKPVGQIDSDRKIMRFDALTGTFLGPVVIMRDSESPDSQRNAIKHAHRMTGLGNWALWINVVVGFGLAGLIVTGVWMYFKIYLPRTRIERKNPFWSSGGAWRSLHRSISIVAALFLTVVMLSGTWLAVESLIFGYYMTTHRPVPGQRSVDPISPLADAAIPGMLQTTMSSYQAAMPGVPARVIRLRFYGGMPQGVVVSGGEEAQQLVFNAVTGKHASETEPGYPVTGFPFGWQAHQWAKMVHRGDMFGLSGRLMDLIAGLSMVYLSISGIVMYWDMWSKRRKTGRSTLFWT